jgi:anti-sigma B factor antagonist
MAQPGDGELKIERADQGSAVVYQVSGEVDTLTSPELDRALAGIYDSTQPVSSVVLDLTNVPFLSSAGLSILVDHHGRCARAGITLSVVAAQRATLRAIQITALDRIIPLHGTVEEALAAVEAN